MHFKNALNAPIYAVSRAFFTQFLAKFRIPPHLRYVKVFFPNHLYILNAISCSP